MKKALFMLFLLAQFAESRGQAPVLEGEKIAYIDSTGKVINQGMFRRGTAFSEGIAAVDVMEKGKKPKWFFIGTDFGIKIPYAYDTVGQFVGGLCPVKKDEYWIYIGMNGLIQIDARFLEAGNFYRGVAKVKDENGVYLINEKGERLTSGYFEAISTWNDSVFGAKPVNGPYWILLNYRGETLLNDSFYAVYPSDNHLVCVNRLGGYRFMDYQGRIHFGKAFLEALPFSQGWASIRMENEWFLMDEKGKLKKDIRMKSGVVLNGSMTYALNYNGRAGYLDRHGNWIYRTQ